VVRLRRVPCPEEACPIFGKIWYDDFNLQRAGTNAGTPATAAGDRAAAIAPAR
jgi:hypothetical protein